MMCSKVVGPLWIHVNLAPKCLKVVKCSGKSTCKSWAATEWLKLCLVVSYYCVGNVVECGNWAQCPMYAAFVMPINSAGSSNLELLGLMLESYLLGLHWYGYLLRLGDCHTREHTLLFISDMLIVLGIRTWTLMWQSVTVSYRVLVATFCCCYLSKPLGKHNFLQMDNVPEESLDVSTEWGTDVSL